MSHNFFQASPLSAERLRGEISQVLAELDELDEHLLPEMAARDPEVFPSQVKADAPPWTEKLQCLAAWKAAVRQLRGCLVASRTAPSRILDAADFLAFMEWEPSSTYEIGVFEIRWKLSCFATLDWKEACGENFGLSKAGGPFDPDFPTRSINAVKRWMLAGSTQDVKLYNPLCVLLPAIADQDPNFARMILDARIWRTRILANAALTEDERRKELSRLDGYFGYVLNNALLHVVAALANNHFMKIRLFLDCPDISGRYTPHLPRYLFAILFAKVRVLSDLGRSIGSENDSKSQDEERRA